MYCTVYSKYSQCTALQWLIGLEYIFLVHFQIVNFSNIAIVILLPIKFQLLQKQYLSLFLTLRSVSDKLTFTLRYRLQDLHIAVVGRTIEKRSHESMYQTDTKYIS